MRHLSAWADTIFKLPKTIIFQAVAKTYCKLHIFFVSLHDFSEILHKSAFSNIKNKYIRQHKDYD